MCLKLAPLDCLISLALNAAFALKTRSLPTYPVLARLAVLHLLYSAGCMAVRALLAYYKEQHDRSRYKPHQPITQEATHMAAIPTVHLAARVQI
jgi:hypothetical protein